MKGIGSLFGCLSISTSLFHFSIFFCVDSSRSEANCAKLANSLKLASSSLNFQATFFMIFVCALPHTRETESPTSIAGLIHELKSSVSKNICPSVIEMTLVGIYADTSESKVSIIGSAVRDPPQKFLLRFADLSSNLECR